MSQYPWGFSGVTPNASDNIPDAGAFTGDALQFTDDGALPGAPAHHYAALVARSDAGLGEAAASGGGFWGPSRCQRLHRHRAGADAERVRRRPIRQGHGR